VSANLAPRVLVVDDYEPSRYLKTHYLLEAGFPVSQADTGRAALRSIEAERPSLVLLDVNLPDMHGSEVCREVKSRWDLPVIYTSSVDVPVELNGMAEGCVVGLDEEELLKAVRQALDDRSHPRSRPDGGAGGGTHWASARSSPPEIAAQAGVFESGLVREALDASTASLLVLNENREIVFCNRAALSLAGAASLPAVVGLQLREAFHCVRPTQSPEGGAAAGSCRFCAATRPALDGLGSAGAGWECRMVRSVNGVEGTRDLMVAVSPMEGRSGFLMCTLADVGRETRRQAPERLFFHDVLNIAAGVRGLAVHLKRKLAGGAEAEVAAMVEKGAAELVKEIERQRLLSKAEAGAPAD
jgi:CheY-like chemotaxis protein